ncbi:CBO0543 family protein [Desulfosporosinus fructosivorans]
MNDSTMTEQIIQTKQVYMQLSIEHWLKYEVFTWQWWIGIACVVIPLFVWWKLVDKQRILEISVFGLLINVSTSFLDVLGSESLLWNYTIRILPQTPLLFPVDFILLPIFHMLIYQRYKTWKQFLFASTIVALALAFVVEPLAVYIKQYQLISWQFIYSFPIYILISILSKLVTNKMLSRQEEAL